MEIKKIIKQVAVQKIEYEEKEVNVYVTEDRKEFTDEKLALEHEESLKCEEHRKTYDNIERFYVGDFPNYDSLEISIVKNQEEVKAILNIDQNVKFSDNIKNNLNSMNFPNIIVVSSELSNYGNYHYYFETIKDIIDECKPLVNFYNKILELKKQYELGDNQYE